MKYPENSRRRALMAAMITAFPLSAQADLIISEYVEGSSNNKALEFYNTGSDAVELSAYEIARFKDGAETPNAYMTLPSFSLAAGAVYVHANSGANDGLKALANSTSTDDAIGFNGGDSVVLRLVDGDIVDRVGTLKEGASSYLKDVTLSRKDTTPNPDFNQDQWQTLAKDAFSGLGKAPGADGGDSGDGGDDPAPTLGACGEAATLISAIKVDAKSIKDNGDTFTVEGIVTGFRSNGFFVQEEPSDEDGNPLTSEGIFAFSNGGGALTLGNLVRIKGVVSDYHGNRQISVSELADCGATDAIATVTPITLPFAADLNLEALEGMVVSVTNAVVANTYGLGRYGEITISDKLKWTPTDAAIPGSAEYDAVIAENKANLLYIEDNTSSQNTASVSFYPEFGYDNPILLGDLVSATGPLNFSYDVYRINPMAPISVTSPGRTAAPEAALGNLAVASFNVLNYFNGVKKDDGSVDYSANPRGAKTEDEFLLQQARIVKALKTLDADVVGLMELENDGFGDDSAINTLVTALNNEIGEDAYTYVSTKDGGKPGTDQITVGLIYRAANVTPKGDAIVIDMPEQTLGAETAAMRPSLVQAFTHKKTGQSFAVSINHFKSKRSSSACDNSAPTDIDQMQGNCNPLRVSAAVTLGEALATLGLPERILILGDLNAYSKEDPISVLTDYNPATHGYTIKTAANTGMDAGAAVEVSKNYGYALVAETHDAEGFSYTYDGAQGSLDHILASSAAMEDIVDLDHWNVNSIEAYALQADGLFKYYKDSTGYFGVGPYRSSDHDPVVVTMDLKSTDKGKDDGGGSLGLLSILALLTMRFARRRPM
ncbi:ExeM/NucH family extracellular endonuclease [Hahella sp. KA22]|uniref:ExeM/NucH family extracellular endonuclease n=1 Tax=Hahella sp. KA22 TaxID=1628392 RepID=UPI000FDEF838|nr:ExeM/NucH family extracellular endonuclease [Hahella sp. KA22]AZZ89950.1 ExeM/NucH family extracellular endonuclease [Hahella sp. KA22]QAY53319.1 ExeM/NucH family extracellular endonuclease [Hahella sp. KA22]